MSRWSTAFIGSGLMDSKFEMVSSPYDTVSSPYKSLSKEISWLFKSNSFVSLLTTQSLSFQISLLVSFLIMSVVKLFNFPLSPFVFSDIIEFVNFVERKVSLMLCFRDSLNCSRYLKLNRLIQFSLSSMYIASIPKSSSFLLKTIPFPFIF